MILEDRSQIEGITNNKGETLLVTTSSAQPVVFKRKEKVKAASHLLYLAGGDTIKLHFEIYDDE